MGAVRQTRADRWKKRPRVLEYHARRDLLRTESNKNKLVLKEEICVTFHITMPLSWSKKKRTQMLGKPHQDKPDIDNLCKFLMDALMDEDKTVWRVWADKYWAEEGYIEVYSTKTAYLNSIISKTET